MKLANGEYIWFVDSDDWIDQNCLNKICGQLDGCDVLYFNNYYDTTYSKERILSMNIDVRTGRELSKKDVKTPPMLYIYRRDFLTKAGHSFAVGMLHEDNLFTPIVLYTAQRVKPYNQPVYHKLSNPNSISHTINSQRCYDLMNVSNKLDMFAKEYVCKTDIWDWGHFIADTINGALAISLKCNSRVRHDLQDFVISHRYLLEYLCHSPKIPTKIMGWLSYKLCVPLVPLYQFLSIFRYKICFK